MITKCKNGSTDRETIALQTLVVVIFQFSVVILLCNALPSQPLTKKAFQSNKNKSHGKSSY